MKAEQANIEWLADTEVFKVNAVSAHSDHKFYLNKEDADKGNQTLKYSLNGEWKFLYSKHIKDRVKDFYKTSFDENNMDKINVPDSIQSQKYNYSQPHYTNQKYPWDGHSQIVPPAISIDKMDEVGSYVKHFDIPKEYKNMRVFISFQGVENAFYVWLNGNFVGYSEDSFTPTEFEITKYLKDSDNKLAVEVHKASTGAWLEDQDFWRLSGIFREVYIYAIPKTHLRDVFVTSTFMDDYNKANLKIEGELDKIDNIEDTSNTYVSAELFWDNKRVMLIDDINVAESNFIIEKCVEEVRLWSVEEPNLYDLYIYVKNNDEIVEVTRLKYGFREFKLDNGIMKLNGKRIVFKGVNRHEFSCYNLRSITEEEMLWDIKFMKKHNINAVRTSHYPNATRWYELCDEYGLYLIDETNLETHGTWNYGKERDMNAIPGDKPEWLYIVLDRAKSMFMRDKNHASILMWSCGNESYGGLNLYKMSEFFRKSDNTRLVHYEGVFNDRTYDATSDIESRMYADVKDIKEYLENNPKKPYINCEYSHAMGNSCGGLSLYTKLESMYEQYQGGFIWDYIDQGIMKKDIYGNDVLAYGGDFADRPTDYNFCTNGIIFADRKTSPKMQEVKYLFSNIVINPNKAGTHIINNNLFVDTSYLKFVYEVALYGVVVDSGEFEAVVMQGEDKLIPIDYKNIHENGEYVITISAVLKNDTAWEKAGYEINFGQYIFVNEENNQKSIYNELSAQKSSYNIVNGRETLGISGKDYEILFDKNKCAIISYAVNGVEYMAKPMYPDYSKAFTDNDKGCGYDYELIQYQSASMVRKPRKFSYTIENGQIKIYTEFENATEKATTTIVKYTVFENGSIYVQATYNGKSGMPVLPQFGMTFATYRQYNNFRYYGNGPMENYSDRCEGARVGVFESSADENMTKYIIPQECGNRTATRWLEVFDNNDNQGIKILSVSSPLDVTVLPYSSFEINMALHQEELAKPYYTYVTISEKKMGVGGDNSWGARPHEEYLLSGEAEHSFDFIITRK